MIGFTSTPSTRPAPNTSAVSRSRPPPGPMTSVVNGDRALHHVKREPGELVLEVLDLRQIAVEPDDGRRGGRVDVHEARLGQLRPCRVELSDQSPCDRSYTATRENEFHLLNSTVSSSCPLVLLTSNGADAQQLQAAGNADRERGDDRGPRRSSCAGENSSAAAPPSTAASSTTPGAPKRFSSGSSSRQPSGGADQIGAVDDVDLLPRAA